MVIKAVFFDLDDTLFDYESCNQKATERIFEDIHNLTGTPTELMPIIFEIAQKEVKTQLRKALCIEIVMIVIMIIQDIDIKKLKMLK